MYMKNYFAKFFNFDGKANICIAGYLNMSSHVITLKN